MAIRDFIDLPGMGLSESGDHIKNSDDMLEVLKSFIQEVIGNESFLVAGESYGGYLTRGLIHSMSDQIEGALFICPMIRAHNRDVPNREIILKIQIYWIGYQIKIEKCMNQSL